MPNSISTENIMDEIIDKLAVGNYIIQIGSIQGASVNVATREERYSLRLRSTPILMPPRPVAQLLSRLEAWALHQLGTCALCLSENADAINYLTKAIQLRQSLGDERGVSATRHNLDLLEIMNLEQTKLHSVGDSDIDKTKIFRQKATDVETPLPQHLTEDSNSQLSSSQHLFTRMNIVRENPSPSVKPNGQGIFLSPLGVITTAILAAGGLLMWFSWHHLTQVTSLPSTMPSAIATRSPVAKRKPKAIELPLPIAKPTSTAGATRAPMIESPLTVDPPLKLPVEFEKQIANTKYKVKNRNSSKSRLKSAPVLKATSTPTVAPTATTELEQPALTPTTKSAQQTSQIIPTPTFTQIPTPIATPTVEATPSATFTPIGIVVPTQP